MALLILNVGTTWEWLTWNPRRSNPVITAYEDSTDIFEMKKFLMPVRNRIPDFQPVAWSLSHWAITAPALHKVHGILLKNETSRRAGLTIYNLKNFWVGAGSHIYSSWACSASKEVKHRTADYTGLCYWGHAMHRTRVHKTGDVRVMELSLNLPRKYWDAVDKNFRQYLIIWSPGVKNIWELKAEFSTPIAPRGNLYYVFCTSEKEIQRPYIFLYTTFRAFALLHSPECCKTSTFISALIDVRSTELRNPLILLGYAN